MAHMGKDMDIFGGLFDDGFDKTDGDKDSKKDENSTADKAEDKGNENSTTDKVEDTTSGEDTKADVIKDKSTGTEISSDVLNGAGDSDSDKDESKDADKDGDNDQSQSGDTDNDIDPDKDGDKDAGGSEGETEQLLEDLVKDLENKVDDVNAGKDDAKDVLNKSLADLKEANIKIKELEEESSTYQNKYLEKFGENSELNLMKPMIESVQNDPELFLLVKNYKNGDSDSKINSLVDMLEKASGVNVSEYLTDNGKGAMRSVTGTGSGDNSTKADFKADFTPDKKQGNEDLVF